MVLSPVLNKEDPLRFRNDDMLLRIAQADAYAAAFEFVRDRSFIAKHHGLEHYVRHPGHEHAAGRYTDDTQMSITVAEALLEDFEGATTPARFAELFLRAFKRDPRPGYTRGFQKILETVGDTSELLATIRGDSEKNGAAMRSVPIGVLWTPQEVLETARQQAAVTHATTIGIFSSQAVALMSHYALYQGDGWDRLTEFCQAHFDDYGRQQFADYDRRRWNGPVHNPALNTVHAVHTLLTTCYSLKEVLGRAVDFGGDTDSVAAIAVGIASARMRDPLPEFMERDLEPGGAYGPVFLKDLGKNLMAKYA